ncbi:MAG: hypothetical protein ACTS8S_04880 [Giesbergeria sp.]
MPSDEEILAARNAARMVLQRPHMRRLRLKVMEAFASAKLASVSDKSKKEIQELWDKFHALVIEYQDQRRVGLVDAAVDVALLCHATTEELDNCPPSGVHWKLEDVSIV